MPTNKLIDAAREIAALDPTISRRKKKADAEIAKTRALVEKVYDEAMKSPESVGAMTAQLDKWLLQLAAYEKKISELIADPLHTSLEALRVNGLDMAGAAIDRGRIKLATRYSKDERKKDRQRLIRIGEAAAIIEAAEEFMVSSGADSPGELFKRPWIEGYKGAKLAWKFRRALWLGTKQAGRQLGSEQMGLVLAIGGAVVGAATLGVMVSFAEGIAKAEAMRDAFELILRAAALPQANATRHVRWKKSRRN